MPLDALRVAERLQPYNANPTANSSLGLLHQLDIVDKHRLPLVATYVGAVAEQRIALKGALVGNVNIIMASDTVLYEYPLHEPRSSRSAQRAAFCAHDGKRDEVVGARSRVEGERAEGEGIRGGARVQGIHVGVLGQLPEARTDR
jgi:hypothetical protein